MPLVVHQDIDREAEKLNFVRASGSVAGSQAEGCEEISKRSGHEAHGQTAEDQRQQAARASGVGEMHSAMRRAQKPPATRLRLCLIIGLTALMAFLIFLVINT